VRSAWLHCHPPRLLQPRTRISFRSLHPRPSHRPQPSGRPGGGRGSIFTISSAAAIAAAAAAAGAGGGGGGPGGGGAAGALNPTWRGTLSGAGLGLGLGLGLEGAELGLGLGPGDDVCEELDGCDPLAVLAVMQQLQVGTTTRGSMRGTLSARQGGMHGVAPQGPNERLSRNRRCLLWLAQPFALLPRGCSGLRAPSLGRGARDGGHHRLAFAGLRRKGFSKSWPIRLELQVATVARATPLHNTANATATRGWAADHCDAPIPTIHPIQGNSAQRLPRSPLPAWRLLSHRRTDVRTYVRSQFDRPTAVSALQRMGGDPVAAVRAYWYPAAAAGGEAAEAADGA
jgi:hypothetical protein